VPSLFENSGLDGTSPTRVYFSSSASVPTSLRALVVVMVVVVVQAKDTPRRPTVMTRRSNDLTLKAMYMRQRIALVLVYGCVVFLKYPPDLNTCLNILTAELVCTDIVLI
jgi:hypothetical protein